MSTTRVTFFQAFDDEGHLVVTAERVGLAKVNGVHEETWTFSVDVDNRKVSSLYMDFADFAEAERYAKRMADEVGSARDEAALTKAKLVDVLSEFNLS